MASRAVVAAPGRLHGPESAQRAKCRHPRSGNAGQYRTRSESSAEAEIDVGSLTGMGMRRGGPLRLANFKPARARIQRGRPSVWLVPEFDLGLLVARAEPAAQTARRVQRAARAPRNSTRRLRESHMAVLNA